MASSCNGWIESQEFQIANEKNSSCFDPITNTKGSLQSLTQIDPDTHMYTYRYIDISCSFVFLMLYQQWRFPMRTQSTLCMYRHSLQSHVVPSDAVVNPGMISEAMQQVYIPANIFLKLFFKPIIKLQNTVNIDVIGYNVGSEHLCDCKQGIQN